MRGLLFCGRYEARSLRGRAWHLVQAGSSVPMPFLAVLVFWLAIIFASARTR
jgi:hypothetical protein